MEKDLNLQQKAFLELVKIGIGTSKGDFDFSLLSSDDWKAVMKESQAQAVSLLCFDATRDFVGLIPPEIYAVWMKQSASTIASNLRVQKAQEELVSLLSSENCPYIILKGRSAAYYYPDPEKRALGDVDFLIDTKYKARITEELTKKDYEKPYDSHGYHDAFFKGKSELEMHYEIAGIPDGVAGEKFREYLKSAETKFEMTGDLDYNKPTDEIHAVVILLHTLHHMLSGGVGIRHLCDWACFVLKTHKEPFWEEEIIPLLRSTGTYTFASVITAVCSKYLASVRPDWCKDISDELCSEVFNDIIELGNFGKKNKERSKSGDMLSTDIKKGKFRSMLASLHSSSYTAYPILNKAPYLYPFIFVYRIVRYLVFIAVGKRPSLVKTNSYANERRAIYSQFKLFENECDKNE